MVFRKWEFSELRKPSVSVQKNFKNRFQVKNNFLLCSFFCFKIFNFLSLFFSFVDIVHTHEHTHTFYCSLKTKQLLLPDLDFLRSPYLRSDRMSVINTIFTPQCQLETHELYHISLHKFLLFWKSQKTKYLPENIWF